MHFIPPPPPPVPPFPPSSTILPPPFIQPLLKRKKKLKIFFSFFLFSFQKLPHPANKNPVPKDNLKARCSCKADCKFIPLTYFCIFAVGIMFIPLDAASYKFFLGGRGGWRAHAERRLVFGGERKWGERGKEESYLDDEKGEAE